ncbi:hypothetical protein [Halalkalibacter alkaliphilus]|uniref:Intracellular proteinase inhibitor BsuPI domain-containing protein n=1 Tax=Halalkalibacter alkaliphilus TaxID=2917993 RepID=A0A9X2A4R6_9BACI|nr:hypothetical protein [Halalkalibacter alkaliphilus]MCL7746858.1 hypothetical protein [Halalkalibacter alkaliphilus]
MKKYKMKTVLASVVVASMALTACGNEEEAAEEVSADLVEEVDAEADEEEATEEDADAADIDYTYELNLDGRTLTFNWEATNFELSVENYGVENVDGEGHAHLWFKAEGEEGSGTRVGINDYNFTTELDPEEFPAGTYEVEVELAENNHTSIPGTQKTETVVID